MEDILSYLKNVPDALPFRTDFDEPNTEVVFYEGDYQLKIGDIYHNIMGKLVYSWTPEIRAKFTGTISTGGLHAAHSLLGSTLKIFVGDILVGQGFIMDIQVPSEGRLSLNGIFSGKIILGDEKRKVDKVSFSIPNHYEYHGEPVKTSISVGNYRLQFSTEDHKIIIDKHPKYKQRTEKLKAQGGYLILCTGEIQFKKDKTIDQATKLCHCLRYFLSFLNGQRTAPLFLFGHKNDEIVWQHYGNFNPSPFMQIENWGTRYSKMELGPAWANFLKLWDVPDHASFLTFAIRWYVEANTKNGFPEGALIMAQTALELIFNWWIVENKKIILGSDAKNLSAENKIRLILSNSNVPAELPLYILADFKQHNYKEEHNDGPNFIVTLRNAIVHANQNKRKKIFELSSRITFLALQLSLWYVEMALLRILEYQGKYYDRNNSIRWHGTDHEHYVPWVTPLKGQE
ncbi:hypothetical protein GCM10027051_35880 [Niabella terrae]